jgi:hypothetical protein
MDNKGRNGNIVSSPGILQCDIVTSSTSHK